MKKICIVTNTSKDKDYILTNKIKDYIVEKGGCCIIDKGSQSNDGTYRYTNPEYIPEDIECVITIGGDGTLLQAAQDLIDTDVVFLGINKGNLGFLAETGAENIYETLDRILNNQFKTDERMMLKGQVYRDGKKIYEGAALNDIVLHRGSGIRIADYKVCVNDLLLNEYHADGIVFATPTGSTAYNLSAGGPVVEPPAELILLTPICAHSINSKSIVLSANDTITIELCPERGGNEETRVIAFDGFVPVGLLENDIIKISKSNLSTKLAKLSDSSFLQVLKNKMGDK